MSYNFTVKDFNIMRFVLSFKKHYGVYFYTIMFMDLHSVAFLI